jgi:hypothetical protein
MQIMFEFFFLRNAKRSKDDGYTQTFFSNSDVAESNNNSDQEKNVELEKEHKKGESIRKYTSKNI